MHYVLALLVLLFVSCGQETQFAAEYRYVPETAVCSYDADGSLIDRKVVTDAEVPEGYEECRSEQGHLDSNQQKVGCGLREALPSRGNRSHK